MRAIIFSELGSSNVLRLVEREPATPGPGEVRVYSFEDFLLEQTAAAHTAVESGTAGKVLSDVSESW
jgi:hypothetical protein